MITIDRILKEIVLSTGEGLMTLIPKKDAKILKNLSILISKSDYISENQGKLLLKIFHENLIALGTLVSDLENTLKTPQWERPFRKIQQIRKIGVYQEDSGEKFIQIDFTFNTALRKILQNLSHKIDNAVVTSIGKAYKIPLTEKNVVLVVDAFKNHNFVVSPEILGFYQIIRSWDEAEFLKDFEILSTRYDQVKEKLKEELEISEDIPDLILADRKIQFQYHFLPNFTGNTTIEKIAGRTEDKIFIDSNTTPLTEVLQALKDLHRLPVMVVFNGYSESESLKNLEKLSQAVEHIGKTESVGIYFRFENTPLGKQFNQIIADKKYNAFLDNNVACAGIIGGKIPKFFLKANWKPQSVITFTNNLKHNKTSVYCNDCDLIIYYNEKQPFLLNHVL